MISGKEARVKIAGSGVEYAGEAFELVSGKTYKITDRTKKVWDRTYTITVYEDGVAVSENDIASIQYLTGQIIFVSTYTGAITADIKSKPLTLIGYLRSYDLETVADLADVTSFCTTATDREADLNESRRKLVQLISASGSVSGFYEISDNFTDIFGSESNVIFEFQEDYADSTTITVVETKLANYNKTIDIENPTEISVDFESTRPVEYEPE